MDYETIKFSLEKGVATLCLNRPEIHNAMNGKLVEELTDCFRKIGKDKDVKVIVLTANGKSFCAGADLNWMKDVIKYSKEENVNESRLLLDMYETIYTCPKPVIAAVNGSAFGGGIGLFAVCDIVIAVNDCTFAFSEVKLGIIPAIISTYVGRRIGTSNMRRLFITGERFDSKYAKEIGLVDHVVSRKKLDSEIKKYIDLLSSSGPNAIKEVKILSHNYEKIDLEEYKEYTVKKISELRASEEGQEGMKAFLEKRKPKWGG